jgi:RecA/RadA recombinase
VPQLCLTLCVTSFLPRDIGGGEGRAMFLDTEGTFRPERLAPIAARFELDHDFVMENVLHQRVLNCDHLEECLLEAAAVLADDAQGPFRVLIVDSIIALYRQEFPGRGELAERQQRIGFVMQALKNLAEVFNLVVIITNQVTATPDASAFMADQKKAVGGNIIAHISDWRVQLRKGKGDQRIAKLIDSPCMPESEAIFAISPGGVDHATD